MPWTASVIIHPTDSSLYEDQQLESTVKINGLVKGESMGLNKIIQTAAEAVSDVFDGAVILSDGFAGPGGMPQELILALRNSGVGNLTIVSNSGGIAGFGSPGRTHHLTHGILMENAQVTKLIASFPGGTNPSRPSSFEQAYLVGSPKIELELVPMGTLAERLRAGGAGIPAFYTSTGVGTEIAEGKEIRSFNGKDYLLEHGLRGDFAFIRAYQADTLGNLVYRGTSQYLNAIMATAADVVIAEVNEVLEPGSLNPELIRTPSVYIDRIVVRINPGIIMLDQSPEQKG